MALTRFGRPLKAARSKAAIAVDWTFMTEILAMQRRIAEQRQVAITFASRVFRGRATDINVHPPYDRSAIASKTSLVHNMF